MNTTSYKITNPDHVELEFQLAGIGSRFCAGLIDFLFMILIIVAAVIALVPFEINNLVEEPDSLLSSVQGSLFIMFILLSAFINLFIGSGSAKWALLAPIFIPMFYMLGYNPALTQMLYRIGDSTTNVISPLFPYMPIILGLTQEYEEDSGVGTVISLMLPYTIAMLIMWIILAIIWVYFSIPLGPGVVIKI